MLHRKPDLPHPREAEEGTCYQFCSASKMRCFVVFLWLFSLGRGHDDDREGKFFFGHNPNTVIAYKQISHFVTEFIPSSCIVIEPTLPPCRHVRQLEISPSVPTQITKTQVPEMRSYQHEGHHGWRPGPQPSEPYNRFPTPPLGHDRHPMVKTHSPYWYWNLFPPFRTQNVTYTETKTEYVTATVRDPYTVVSFYVKGCRPSRLPFNLPECHRYDDIYIPPVANYGGGGPGAGAVPGPVPGPAPPAANTETEEGKNIVIMAPLRFIHQPGTTTEITPSKAETTTTPSGVNIEDILEETNETTTDYF